MTGTEHQITEIRSLGLRSLGPPRSRGVGETLVTPLSVIPGGNELHLMPRGEVAHHFVQVTTASGIVGYGIVGAFDGSADNVIRDHLAKFVLGRDPSRSNIIWELMYRGTLAYGRKGIVLSAISALDIAIWDLKAKILDVPLHALLGGPVRDSIPVYASRLYATMDTEVLVAEAKDYVRQGYTALKMRFGYGPAHGARGLDRNVAQLAAVREAVGPGVRLMADVYMGWDHAYAVKALTRLAQYDLYWLEEPLGPDDIEGMGRLRAIANSEGILIAAGEHEYTRFGCRDLLRAGAIDVLQVDANRVGGITEAARCWTVASAFGVPVVPHSGQLHNLHLVACNANSLVAENFPPAQGNPDRNELYQQYWEGEPQAVAGHLTLPDRPGVGIEPNWTVVEPNIIFDRPTKAVPTGAA